MPHKRTELNNSITMCKHAIEYWEQKLSDTESGSLKVYVHAEMIEPVIKLHQAWLVYLTTVSKNNIVEDDYEEGG